MNYYWFNREKLLKNAWDKYHNKGGKQKAGEYYKKIDLIILEARNKYRNLPEKGKKKKKKYQRERYHMNTDLNERFKQYQKKLLCFKKNKIIIRFYSIKYE